MHAGDGTQSGSSGCLANLKLDFCESFPPAVMRFNMDARAAIVTQCPYAWVMPTMPRMAV